LAKGKLEGEKGSLKGKDVWGKIRAGRQLNWPCTGSAALKTRTAGPGDCVGQRTWVGKEHHGGKRWAKRGGQRFRIGETYGIPAHPGTLRKLESAYIVAGDKKKGAARAAGPKVRMIVEILATKVFHFETC